jgi:GntR family transcriptional regulator, transcriptional repressor for pyruvate dehydrogenase complex
MSRLARSPSMDIAPRAGLPIASIGAVTMKSKTSETVARRIVGDIVNGGLRPGDRLPAEAAMIEWYCVSRQSLREGLRLLEMQGLLMMKRGPGGGPVVQSVDPANLGRISTLYFHLSGGTYRELIDAWVLAESTLAARAARHPDPANRRSAMLRFADPDVAIPPDNPAFIAEHTLFHAEVARLSDNRVMEIWLQSIGQIVSRHVANLGNLVTMHGSIGSDHGAIAHAIMDGNVSRARAEMEAHIRSVGDQLHDEFSVPLDDHIEWR